MTLTVQQANKLAAAINALAAGSAKVKIGNDDSYQVEARIAHKGNSANWYSRYASEPVTAAEIVSGMRAQLGIRVAATVAAIRSEKIKS